MLAQLVFPIPGTTKAVVDLFALTETPLCTLGKRPHLEDFDPNIVRVRDKVDRARAIQGC